MRLIDADRIKIGISEKTRTDSEASRFIDIINRQPTAFDLESAIEKLKSAVYRIDDSASLCSRDVINEEDVFEILKYAANATNGRKEVD